jgi:hypothetical protein
MDAPAWRDGASRLFQDFSSAQDSLGRAPVTSLDRDLVEISERRHKMRLGLCDSEIGFDEARAFSPSWNKGTPSSSLGYNSANERRDYEGDARGKLDNERHTMRTRSLLSNGKNT